MRQHGWVDAALDERALSLFKGLVESYIADGEPVGSRTLVRALDLNISAATARNVMADLERAGLIVAPHTSAGRIPTQRGLRFFVDSLLTTRQFGAAEIARMADELSREVSSEDLAAAASGLLAGMSRMAGIVRLPRPDVATLQHIEFLPLSENRLLAILVTSDGEVHNRVVQVQHQYDKPELERAARYLVGKCGGKTLAQMRRLLLEDLRQLRAAVEQGMAVIMEVADQLADSSRVRKDLVVSGESNLLSAVEAGDGPRLQGLFKAFAEKWQLLELLDQCLRADGVQVFIGNESGFRFLNDYSVVTSTYEQGGEILGVLGVIGPTRMPYAQVVAVVDITAKLLGAALNRRGSAP